MSAKGVKMTNKEKLEKIKYFVDKQDILGILESFLIDDAYKDIDFIKFIKSNDPQLFYSIHPIILKELDNYQKVTDSIVFILEKTNLSKETKYEVAKIGKDLTERCKAIICAAKELNEIFDKAN